MILDRIENAPRYYGLSDRIAAACRALLKTDLLRAESGRYELDGAAIHALPQRYLTKPRAQGKWEAHRRYLDIQYVVAGAEVMGHAPLADLTVTTPYNERDDNLFLAGQGDFVTVAAGRFAIFFPDDAHMPGLAVNDTPAPVHKIVIKVRVGS